MPDVVDAFAPVEAVGRTTPAADGNGRAYKPHVVMHRVADVPPEEVSWLWPNRIPAGKLSLWVGDPGVGKSFESLDVAARLSNGTSWPDARNTAIEPGSTVILSAEDDIADTIRPRLDAAGADCSRIHAIVGMKRSEDGERCYFSLDTDLRALEDAIVEVDAKLCIVDPLSAYLGERDSHRDSDIRGLLAPLADLAARHRCAVLAISHMNKSNAGKALYRAMGSLAFTAAARIGWLIARDADNESRRLMLPLKSNLIEKPSGIAFEIVDGVVRWFDGAVNTDADSVLGAEREGQTERKAAAAWLEDYLLTGPAKTTEIERAARANCHSWPTVRRAKENLGLKVRRHGFGKDGHYTWELPAESD